MRSVIDIDRGSATPRPPGSGVALCEEAMSQSVECSAMPAIVVSAPVATRVAATVRAADAEETHWVREVAIAGVGTRRVGPGCMPRARRGRWTPAHACAATMHPF